MSGQAFYVEEGLPEHVAGLLSVPKVPRGEVAASVLTLLQKKDNERLRLKNAANTKDHLLQQVTRRYLQLKGMFNSRGIMGASCTHHYLLVTSTAPQMLTFYALQNSQKRL
jgi:hypothetical protein